MKLNVLAIALAATAFGSLSATAQTTTIIEDRRAPAVVIEQPAPSTTITTQERGGFLGTESKTTTTTTGTGLTGDCATRTMHKQDLTGEKTVSRTDCP
ncbi:MAG: hypothetical protein WCI56_13905 [Hyphomicrobiales bacterium]